MNHPQSLEPKDGTILPLFLIYFLLKRNKITTTIPINATQTSTNVILLVIIITGNIGLAILGIKVVIVVLKMFIPKTKNVAITHSVNSFLTCQWKKAVLLQYQ